MDKNQTTGLLLMSALLLAYFAFFSDPNSSSQSQQLPNGDTLAVVKADSGKYQQPQQTLPDSLLDAKFGFFALGVKADSNGTSSHVLENEDVKITFSSRGARISSVVLKKHVDYRKQPLVLFNEQTSKMQEWMPTKYGPINLNELNYQVAQEGNKLVFRLSQNGQLLARTFELPSTGYVLNYRVAQQGLDGQLAQGPLQFKWENNMRRLEKDLNTSRMGVTMQYYTDEEDFDYLSETSSDREEEALERPAKWVSMKQKFFNASIITDKAFENVSVTLIPSTDTVTEKTCEMALAIPQASLLDGSANVRFYFGPNDYDICETVAPGFQKNVYLGWKVFMPVSLYIITPIFQFLEGFDLNYGIIILILVLIVKTALFPLTYKSYLSMAKMRVLKPEMDALREQYGDDMQKIQQESLKIQSEFGVSPLSGCIPVLAQMPITVALFTFFPNAIQLRKQSFLWADDLSSYDSILDLPFAIPMYGAHVSLFTLLMTVVTLISTYYNNEMNSASAAMQGPMKYIGYIMPVMFLFFLNSYSSGLTYYYFLSTAITIGQQLISKQFIDEKAIREKLEEKRKNNKGKKSMMGRVMDAMRQQQEQIEQQRSAGEKMSKRLRKPNKDE